MKRLLYIVFTLFCFSCGESTKEVKNSNFDFSYKVDTVMVDAGDGLIFHQIGLSHSDISKDQKLLYNFTPKSELEVIDLDNLRLNEKIATDKEGTLGTGWPYAIQIDQAGNLVFYGVEEVRIFNSNLSSMNRFQLSPEALSGLEPDVISMFNPKIINGKFLYSIYENNEQVPQGLAIVSLEEKSVKKIPLDLADRIKPYTYSLQSNSKGHEPINLELIDNNLIISTAYANEAILLDLESETVSLKTFHSELTGDKKKIPARTSAETINELEDFMKEGKKSVTFGRFYFDPTNRKFFRFFMDLEKAIGDSLVFKNVLTVFDQELNQLAETEVPVDTFSKKFFKDGKIWSYVNVEDELGFAVFTFDF